MNKSYQVEDVLAKKQINGIDHYRIKWQGYPSWQNTWEPLANLTPEVIAIWEEKQAKKKKFIQDRESKKKIKQQEKSKQKIIQDCWWNQLKIRKHFYDKQGELKFEIQKENKIKHAERQQLIEHSPQLLAKYYIEVAKKQGIY